MVLLTYNVSHPHVQLNFNRRKQAYIGQDPFTKTGKNKIWLSTG